MAGSGLVQPRGQRVPGVLNLLGAALVVAIVIPLTLRAAQSSPPAIAEFAPTPQHAIANAPPEQTSSFGRNPNGAAGAPAPSPSPTRPAIKPSAELKHCVGDPPRQTEDPQSPPCVA